MRDRTRQEAISWTRFFCFSLFVVAYFSLFTGFTFSTLRLFGEKFRPVIVSPWKNSILEALSEDAATSVNFQIKETVLLPDQVLIFLNYHSASPLLTKNDLYCSYFPPNSSKPQLKLPPLWIDTQDSGNQIIRCRVVPRRFTTSISLKFHSNPPQVPTPYRWDSLVYEAVVDRDNSTVVFVKGLKLRPGRLADASRYECVYGWDFKKPRLLLTAEALSAAQEIVRCKTPLSVLNSNPNKPVKVSIRVKGRGILDSIARPQYRLESDRLERKKYDMCVCTMVRNQAKFIREWVMYHSHIGVEQWFIYDNNSDDSIDEVIELLVMSGYKITRHVWPWIKTQEAGFAHCALRARETCEWVGFIDVDEFLHFPSGISLHDMIQNRTIWTDRIGELRVSCHNFGPSGLRKIPAQGVSVGYTCRLAIPERHKSIVRPEVLNSSLINVVHHFHIRDDYRYINVDKTAVIINHYKYQVWDVFKEKFYRRVATYVVDWKKEQNVGSKDRAPGLGTKAVEPLNWPSRFCEVNDTGLREQVLKIFKDPQTKRLPWQEDNA